MLKRFLAAVACAATIVPPVSAHATTEPTCSYASHYGVGDGFHGRRSANGERFDAYGNTVAHRWLPFGTRLRITNPRTGKSVIARVTDRGPFIHGRSLDMSYGAFSQVASPSRGVVKVCYAAV